MSRFPPPGCGKGQWTTAFHDIPHSTFHTSHSTVRQGDGKRMVTGRQEVAAPPEPRPCAGQLPDLSGLDLTALRGIAHPVLAEVIEGLVERVTHPAEILNAFDSGVA
ncbi:FXSXX-COOH protein [Streptomyces sp. 3211.6]|nr:FXSXX-COOH protein [Streptomyces sp. 3211.6]RPF45523.1 FXSXX-COOH protein [Streptomyces sp. Ag109_G2-6]